MSSKAVHSFEILQVRRRLRSARNGDGDRDLIEARDRTVLVRDGDGTCREDGRSLVLRPNRISKWMDSKGQVISAG